MKSTNKTKEQLLKEIELLQTKIAELEKPETEQMRVEEALRIERDKLKNVFEAMEDGIYIVSQEYDIQYVNPVLTKDFGVYEGRKCYEYFHDREEVCPWCKNPDVFEGKTVRWEWYSSKNQKTYDLIDTPLKNPDGSILKLEIFRDITERKQAEEMLRKQEARIQSIFRSAPVGIGLVSDRILLQVNDRLCEITGYASDELINQNARMLYPTQEDYDFVGKQKYEQIKKSGSGTVETRFKRKDGKIIDILLSSTQIGQGDLEQGVTFTVLDITKRKKAEDDLRESEERYRGLFKNNHSVMLLIDPENADIVDANPAALSFYGWSFEELTGKKITDINLLSKEEVYQEMEKAKKEQRNHFYFRHRLSNGQICDVEVYSGLIYFKDKKLLYSIVHDISQQRKAEEKLLKSEIKFRLLADHTYDWEYWVDPDGNYIYISPSCERITGYSPEEYIFTPELLSEMVKPGYADKVHQHYKDENNKDTPIFSMEFPITTKNGKECWLEHNCSPVFDDEGNYMGRRGNNRDITERKQAEEALKESKEKLRIIFDSAADGIVETDLGGNIVKINKAILRIYGSDSEDDFIGKSALEFYAPSERARALEAYKKTYLQSIAEESEFIALKIDGTPFSVQITSALLQDDGNRVGFVGIIKDITERKKAEEEIKNLAKFPAENPNPILRIELNGFLLYANESAKAVFSDWKLQVGQVAPEALQGFILEVEEDRVVHKDIIYGERIFSVTATLFKDTEYVNIYADDITERKRAEEEIKEKTLELERQIAKSEEQRIATLSILSDLNKTTEELLFEINVRKQTEESLLKNEFFLTEAQRIAKLGSYELDVLSGYWTTSDEINNVFGIDDNYDRNVEGWENIMHPEDREDMHSYLTNDVLKEHNKFDREYRIIRVNDNEERWVHGIGELEFDDQDKPVKMIGTIQDITERKLAEEEIRKLSHSVEQSPGIVVITDTNGNIEYVNPKFEEVTGYTEEEVIGKNPNILKGDDTTPEEYEILWKTIKAGGTWHGEFHNRRKNGELYWESASISGIKDRNEQTTHFIAIKEDITERKAMEQRIRKSRNQLRSLAERLQMIREEERASIAREIHDDLGQTLTALKMDISWMKKNPGMTEEMRAEKINTMLELTDSTIQTVKRIATELRPGILDDLGLIPAIEWETEEFRKRSGIKCNLEISVEEISVEDNISIAVFRIFQESLTNIARHSGATKVEMTIKSKGNLIQMEITDNGIGITEEQMRSPKSLGLMGMKERVSFFGGKLAISKSEEGGTSVMVYIPIIKE